MPPKEKPLIASRTVNPLQAAGSFIKSTSPDFIKIQFLCVLCASVVQMFLKGLLIFHAGVFEVME
jgi:hypothetical protein